MLKDELYNVSSVIVYEYKNKHIVTFIPSTLL